MHDFCYKNNMSDKPSRSEPHVEIFGDSMRYRHHHHDSGSPVSGVMFLFAGIMLLFNSMGTVPWVVWHTIWQFWPVLFIFMGLQATSMLGRSYGFCTQNGSKNTRNSFTETTLRTTSTLRGLYNAIPSISCCTGGT